jgi:hypothetical protein
VREGVEEEVRLHLGLQRLEPGFGRARAQLVARKLDPRDLGRTVRGASRHVPRGSNQAPPQQQPANHRQVVEVALARDLVGTEDRVVKLQHDDVRAQAPGHDRER